jgi:hypothetical protein
MVTNRDDRPENFEASGQIFAGPAQICPDRGKGLEYSAEL